MNIFGSCRGVFLELYVMDEQLFDIDPCELHSYKNTFLKLIAQINTNLTFDKSTNGSVVI